MSPVQRIGIFCKQRPAISREVLSELTGWLRKKNLEVRMAPDTAAIIGEAGDGPAEQLPAACDLLIVLGGDGTLLSVGRLAHGHDVPILAVNLGSLGFLTEVALPEMYPTLEHVLSGRAEVENRMLLKATLRRDGQPLRQDVALNDVAVNKISARIMNLEVQANHQYMTSYRADGLIIATPTGSTAYSLSAGGPIIHPSMHALLLSPICPFALTNRPIAIPDTSVLEIRVTTEEDVQITLDGQTGYPMSRREALEVERSPTPVRMIQAPGKNYYQILRRKLHWGRPADEQKPE